MADQNTVAKELMDSIDVDRLRKDLDALRSDIAALGGELTNTLKSVSGTAQASARRGYKIAQDGVTATVSDLRKQGASALEQVQDTAESLEESLEDAVRQRPLAAVGLAIGLGFLIGATWRR